MKIIKFIGLVILTTIVYLSVQQYFFCPSFNFINGASFSGTKIYNPYQNTDSSAWIKANFHAHCKTWAGVTNGRGTAKDIWNAYDSLGYAIHSVSNYHQVDTGSSLEPNYIEAYEHGYNLQKTHQLLLGTNKVSMLDYIFPQTKSNKQWLLNSLRVDTTMAIILNHPSIRKGYNQQDLSLLFNYDCMEILNPAGYSFAEWDAALSSGHPIFACGNDDIHNVFDSRSLGNHCTWLNVEKPNKENVLKALKTGKGYAMKVGFIPTESIEEKKLRHKNNLPQLLHLTVMGNELQLAVSQKADSIIFSGQAGKRLAVQQNCSNSSYKIQLNDSYVRTSIYYPDGTAIFLNPVFRYSQDPFFIAATPFINNGKTFLFNLCGWLILSGWVLLLYRLLLYKYLRKYTARQVAAENMFPSTEI